LAASLTTEGDTIIATTPARLRLQKDVSGANLTIEVMPGEPWIHATPSRRSSEEGVDLWGALLRINRESGHPILWAPVLSTAKRSGQ
jgi:hypothetical protein